MLLGKERIAVRAAKNVMAAIGEGDVPSSFRFLESTGEWKGQQPVSVETNNVQINIATAEDALAVYFRMVKGERG